MFKCVCVSSHRENVRVPAHSGRPKHPLFREQPLISFCLPPLLSLHLFPLSLSPHPSHLLSLSPPPLRLPLPTTYCAFPSLSHSLPLPSPLCQATSVTSSTTRQRSLNAELKIQFFFPAFLLWVLSLCGEEADSTQASPIAARTTCTTWALSFASQDCFPTQSIPLRFYRMMWITGELCFFLY